MGHNTLLQREGAAVGKLLAYQNSENDLISKGLTMLLRV